MLRLVTQLPLTELWDDAGAGIATRARDLTADDIRVLLRVGRVRFVVADVGEPLRWVPTGECFRFWKEEVQLRVADHAGVHLDDFPGGYCYFAAEWATEDGPLVVLSKAH